MSRTKKGTKPPGYDYWGKRKPNFGHGKITKRITHRLERLIKKKIIRKEIKELVNE